MPFLLYAFLADLSHYQMGQRELSRTSEVNTCQTPRVDFEIRRGYTYYFAQYNARLRYRRGYGGENIANFKIAEEIL